MTTNTKTPKPIRIFLSCGHDKHVALAWRLRDDLRERGHEGAKEALYRPRYERLLKAVEDKQLDFEGVQNRLLKVLQPISFSADILKLLKDFTGREWVFKELDAWLRSPEESKIFWITGAPGVGKRAATESVCGGFWKEPERGLRSQTTKASTLLDSRTEVRAP